jgi:hypothetical protein
METTKMLKTVLAAALIVGAASTARASDNSGEYHGGFVVPGSMDGVNPAYHPRWFGGHAAEQRQGAESFGYVTPRNQAGGAYGYAAPHGKTVRPAPQRWHEEDNYGPEAGKD